MIVGQLAELRRFPVKSMAGEPLPAADVGPVGLVGDRNYAVLDVESGKVASAKDPRRWPGLLDLHAAYEGHTAQGARVQVTLPSGDSLCSDDPALDTRLSTVLGRQVQLVSAPPPGAAFDYSWPNIPGLAPQEVIDAYGTALGEDGQPITTHVVALLAPGTFQDVAPISLLTTASLATGVRIYPGGSWNARRFRPNLLIDVAGEHFLENSWTGRRVEIGDVVLEVIVPTARCVMVTLSQAELLADRELLRTLGRHNRVALPSIGRFACFGAYASVIQTGSVAVGDRVCIQDSRE